MSLGRWCWGPDRENHANMQPEIDTETTRFEPKGVDVRRSSLAVESPVFPRILGVLCNVKNH